MNDLARSSAAAPARRGEVWAFWLGVASLTCLGPLSGVLAVLVGAISFARAPRGDKPPLAIAGILAGAFGTAAGLVVSVGLVSFWEARREREAVQPGAALVPESAETPVPRDPPLPPGHPPIGPRDPELPTAAEPIGRLTLVRVAADERRSLAALLRENRHEHAPLLIYIKADRCAPCKRFEGALGSAPMQAALGASVLLAVDAAAFELDLRALRIDAHDVPTFVRLTDDAEPVAADAITGVEWDEDTPANMAPVFTRFLAGTLQKRREAPPFVGTSL